MQLQIPNIGFGAATILAVANGQLPEYIYKFYPINDNLHSAIRDKYIWFCSHEEFNDPFDCQLQVDTKGSQKEIQAYLKFAYTNSGRQVSREYLRQQVRDCDKHPE
jgi:hypothetical protein